jgi:hypothetical protein
MVLFPLRLQSERWWLRASISSMSKKRCDYFNRNSKSKLRFGSDCSGSDSAFMAATQWVTDPINEMMSEAPDAYAPVLFGMLNHAPKVFFRDVMNRCFSGPCFINGECTRAPSNLDMYGAGTVCKDFSSANQLNPKKFSGA